MIAPVDVFKDKPPGNAPEAIEYVTALSDVAAIAKLAVPPAAKEPIEPEAVLQVGASETVSKAVELLPAKPSGFSTLTKYVPSTANVALTVNCVALFLVTVFG